MLRCSGFFTVQLSHPYMTTGKTIALTRRTFVGKVIPRAYSNSCTSHWWLPSNHFIFCRPPLLLPSIFPSIWVFSNESVLHIRWPKYWSFSFSISPSSEYSGLISFRMDWLDLLAVQGTLKSFSNTTVQKHQFFCTQLLQSNSHIHT